MAEKKRVVIPLRGNKIQCEICQEWDASRTMIACVDPMDKTRILRGHRSCIRIRRRKAEQASGG